MKINKRISKEYIFDDNSKTIIKSLIASIDKEVKRLNFLMEQSSLKTGKTARVIDLAAMFNSSIVTHVSSKMVRLIIPRPDNMPISKSCMDNKTWETKNILKLSKNIPPLFIIEFGLGKKTKRYNFNYITKWGKKSWSVAGRKKLL